MIMTTKQARAMLLAAAAEARGYHKSTEPDHFFVAHCPGSARMVPMFTVQFRQPVAAFHHHAPFAALSDAVRWGFATRQPFDVSIESGAIVWVWEMRP